MNIVDRRTIRGVDRSRWTYVLLGLALASGCGEPRVSLGTRPAPLRVTGTLEAVSPDAGGGEPVALDEVAEIGLMFRSDDAFHVVPTDWEIDGNAFRLRVLDAPAEAVLRPLSTRLIEEPTMAIGFITALREPREGRIPIVGPRRISFVPESEVESVCGGCGGPPEPPGFNATGVCTQDQYCTFLDEECYTEFKCCTEACGDCRPLGSQGDEALKVDARSYFGGHTVTHAVVLDLPNDDCGGTIMLEVKSGCILRGRFTRTCEGVSGMYGVALYR